MTKMTKARFLSRRGVSLLETVIALTVIMMVSASALSLVVISTRVETQNMTKTEALSYSESVVECFRYAKSNDEMQEALSLLDEAFVSIDALDNGVFETVSDGAGLYRLRRSGFVITVIADFTDKKVEISAVDNNGKEINGLTYEKY